MSGVRCPMECSMSRSSESWSCSITLRFDYDKDGNQQSQRRVPFKTGLNNKQDVSVWLRRAQAAVLNPSIPVEEFFNKSVDELRKITNSEGTGLKFSRNVVALNIEDPDATDLSFIDLPGMFRCNARKYS